MTAQYYYDIFTRSVSDYHLFDHVDAVAPSRYDPQTMEGLLYRKSWIDTVQWHLEDLIRDPAIRPEDALLIKRRIDSYNQLRTDIVESIDDYFQGLYCDVAPADDARHNTESLGWAVDRLSILCLKEYHVEAELNREDASEPHRRNCSVRKEVIGRQKEDLFASINWLMDDIRTGRKINKVYRQLKMYNDPSFNPVLYKRNV